LKPGVSIYVDVEKNASAYSVGVSLTFAIREMESTDSGHPAAAENVITYHLYQPGIADGLRCLHMS